MKELLEFPNVVAVGRGIQTTGGEPTGEPAIVVSVTQKVPLDELPPEAVIPAEVDGEQTDVVETGVIRAFERTSRERPAFGGDSIGHVDVTAGTLGCVLRRDGQRVILSNNHVLANSNAAGIGDEILQPGAHDGGSSPVDVIAHLSDFVPVEFNGVPIPSECPIGGTVAGAANLFAQMLGRETRLFSVRAAGENLVDAAIALPVEDGFVSDEIRDIGFIYGTQPGELGMPLIKSGRTTDVTRGEVTQVDVTVQVQYGEGKIAVFTDQLMAGAMSAPGDSGSAVLSLAGELVGLLFAGSDAVTVINRAEHVLDLLRLESL